jgi:hypothetical protein
MPTRSRSRLTRRLELGLAMAVLCLAAFVAALAVHTALA